MLKSCRNQRFVNKNDLPVFGEPMCLKILNSNTEPLFSVSLLHRAKHYCTTLPSEKITEIANADPFGFQVLVPKITKIIL